MRAVRLNSAFPLLIRAALAACLTMFMGQGRAEGAISIAKALSQTAGAQDGSFVAKAYAAYDPENNVYLVVWSNFQSWTYGQLVSGAGNVIGTPFRISPLNAGYVKVVWGADGFFVTYNKTGTSQRWGRFITYDGTLQMTAEQYLYDCYSIDSDQGMTYLPASKQYLLTYWLNASKTVPYTRSFVVGVKDRLVNIPATQVSQNESGRSQDSPDIACDAARGRCLVVGKAWDNFGFIGTWGRVISATSGLPSGNVFYMDGGSGLKEDQRVAFSPVSGRFVTTWVRSRAQIVARRVFSDLSVEGAYYTVIGGSYGQQSISYHAATDTFLVSFKNATSPAQNFSLELSGLGNVSSSPLQLSTIGTTGDGFPLTVPNVGAKQFLALHSVNYRSIYTGLLAASAASGGGTDPAPPPPTSPTSNPQMSLDAPTTGTTMRAPLSVAGWAVDKGAATGTGVDTVHVWAYPNPGSGQAAMFLGAAQYGLARPDVGSAAGDPRFTNSGFGLEVSYLQPGAYQIVAFARSTVTGTFSQSRIATVTVRGAAVMLDTPKHTSAVASPYAIAGWAVDTASTSGTGIDKVAVYAYPDPGSSKPAILLGLAPYGGPRPDVAAALGSSRFTNSGFHLNVTNMWPGPYQVVAFAHVIATNQWVPALANVTVKPGPLMAVDSPGANQSIGAGATIAGWATDLSAASGTGVDVVQVWVYPASGAAPIFLGTAAYGGDRQDVGTAFGAQFRFSGYSLSAPPLPKGNYTLVVFARSSVTGQFNAVPIAISVN